MSMRVEVKVVRIEGTKAICRTSTGREHGFEIRTLERGARSARLVTNADGTPADARPEEPPKAKTYSEQAVDLHRAGMPLVEIARQLKTHLPQVVAWIRNGDGPRAGMPTRRQPAKPKGAPTEQALQIYEMRTTGGMTNAEVAEALGIARNTASKYYVSVREERGGR